MTDPEPEKPSPAAPKQRLLHHLARQLVIHVHALSLLCYTAGFVAVFLLPLLAKPTYISENALMPGSGSPVFGMSDTFDARASATEIKSLLSPEQDVQWALSRWLVRRMGALGADCYLQPIFPDSAASNIFQTSPLGFNWSKSNLSSGDDVEKMKGTAINLVGIIRAPQGEGNEAIVIVTPFNGQRAGQEDATTLGLGLALFARLSKALWIARDIIWLVADAKYGAYPAVAEWLREYHEPTNTHMSTTVKLKSKLVKQVMSSAENTDYETLSDFKRAGTIATGLVFDIKMIPGQKGDIVKLRAEGPNGQMPNLDLINIINSIAVWRESLSIELEALPSLQGSDWLGYIGNFLERVSNLARQISPAWDFSSAAVAYPKTLATLLSSMFVQVTGMPTGAHGAFRDYQIDAVTLQFPAPDSGFDYSLTKFGRLLEGVLRSVNNLLEKWHQSFFLYFLSAPHKYISVGLYMQPFALLLISLPLTAAALCFPVIEESGLTNGETKIPSTVAEIDNISKGSESTILDGKSQVDNSGTWLQALLLISTVQIWAFFCALMLTVISQTKVTADLKLFSWLAVVVVGLRVLWSVQKFLASLISPRTPPSQCQSELWMAVKALTMGVASIGLAVMSTINYPVALSGALVLVPMCLGVFPLQYGWQYAHQPGKSIVALIPFVTGAFLVLLGSPLGLAGLVKVLYGNFWKLTFSNVWLLMESLLSWQSALLPYFVVIHLPCSVLCLYILLSFNNKE